MNVNHQNKLRKAIQEGTRAYKPLLEFSEEQKEGFKTAAAVTLAIIASAGILVVAAAAPNIFVAVNRLYRKRGWKLSFKEKQEKAADAFYYLKRHGLIEIVPEKRGLIARLTQKGKDRVEQLRIVSLRIPKIKKWDGKWWLVAADIPTKDYRWAADLFRKKIKEMGFYSLQRTLWLYPYNPTEEIEFLARHFGIGQFVTAMEINRLDIDDEGKLKEFFGL